MIEKLNDLNFVKIMPYQDLKVQNALHNNAINHYEKKYLFR